MIALANSPRGYQATHQAMLESLGIAFVEALTRLRIEQARAAGERKLQAISDAALDAVIMMDPAGRIAHWNPAAERIFGLSPEEALGKPLHETLAHPRFHGRAFAAVDTFRATGGGAAVGKTIEAEGRRQDGTEFPLEISLAPIQLDGQWWGVATVRDITERKEAEVALRRFNDELIIAKMELERRTVELTQQASELEHARANAEAASRTKSAFLASISHELRTPMNSIIGFTGLLLDRLRGSISESDLDSLRTVERNTQDLMALINRVLMVSKFEAGAMTVRRSKFDIWPVVRDAAEEYTSMASQKQLHFRVHWPATPTWIESDSTIVGQIVSNLVSNAIKHTQAGSVSVSAREVEDADIGPAVSIRVADTGVGIKPEDRGRMFDMFSRLDDRLSSATGGPGLGLYMVSRYVQMLGGRIVVDSQVGEGSTFTVILPQTQGATGPREMPPRDGRRAEDRQAAPTDEAPGRGIGLLCIDDDPDSLRTMRATLTDAGYQVMLIEDYDTALEQPWPKHLDIALLDLAVPGENAFEVLTALQRGGTLSRVPLVIMSLRSEEAPDVQAAAHYYLTAASETRELVATLRESSPCGLDSILVVDEDADTGPLGGQALSEWGIEVRTANGREEAVQRLAGFVPSAVVLNLSMSTSDLDALLLRIRRIPELRTATVLLRVPPGLGAGRIAALPRATGALMSRGKSNTVELIDALLGKPLVNGCSLKETPS
jgi:PAS domain S-box-containing protein